MLLRTEADAATCAVAGSRVRLVKGAYARARRRSPTRTRREIDMAYVRCLEILMSGEGYPMIGIARPAHDRRSRRSWPREAGRKPDS